MTRMQQFRERNARLGLGAQRLIGLALVAVLFVAASILTSVLHGAALAVLYVAMGAVIVLGLAIARGERRR